VQEASARAEQAGEVDVLIAQARARAATAHAQVAVAQAARDLAALELSYTKIVAPQDGVVSKKTASVGQMLAAGQGIVQLVPTRELWVTANFKETQITKMRAGQPAKVEVDAFPGVGLHGEVESFSAATGARFSLLPPDNASGNFTKVVQRVPVRVKLRDLPQGVALRPGMSVELTIDTRK
jgi:membrane fusion protein (multidrug efflux system)